MTSALFCTPERFTSPWPSPVIETVEYPPLAIEIAFPLVEIPILLFRNLFVFVSPVPPLPTPKDPLEILLAFVASVLGTFPKPTKPLSMPVKSTFEYPPRLILILPSAGELIPI